MFLKKGFSKETRELFEELHACCWCMKSKWNALHHIMGRTSSSPYNAAPIHNIECHIGNFALDSFENRSKILKKTKKYLDEIGYKPNKTDLEFLKKNKRLYEY